MKPKTPFKWRHFQAEIILLNVRWYLRYPLSYRNLEEMMIERGLSVDHTTIYRWVIAYAPQINKRCRKHLKSTNDSWKVDETYIKVNGEFKYLYRAIDSDGQIIDSPLTAKRDAVAAKRFLKKIIGHEYSDVVRVINTDKAKAYPKAIEELKESSLLPESVEARKPAVARRMFHSLVEHRAVKYLNNLIEQDHRYTKLRVITSQNFRNFWSAGRTIAGYESINMIRKGQIQNVKRGDVLGQIRFINSLFAIVV